MAQPPADTSEYPGSHSWICFAQDENLSADVLDVVQSASDAGSRTILEMVNKLLAALARKVFAPKTQRIVATAVSDGSESEPESIMEEDDDSTYNDHTDDEDFGGGFGTSGLNAGAAFDLAALKRYAATHSPKRFV